MNAQRDQWSALSDDEWRDLVLRSADEDVGLPPPPPFEVQRRFNVAPDTVANLAVGFKAYRIIRDALVEFGRPLTPESRVLDFGCGWGRVARFFLRDVPPQGLHGVDISEVGIAAAQKAFGPERFRRIETWPPIDEPDASFDLVYAISVFSHLSEALHLAWLAEIERLLKPGGILVATTLGRDTLQADRSGTMVFDAFEDPAAALHAYDIGEFVYAPKPMEHYGMALISEDYALRHWQGRLVLRRYAADRAVFAQNVLVVQKS